MTAAAPPPSGGIAGLVAEALRAAGDVLRGEITLFRQEMADTYGPSWSASRCRSARRSTG